MDRETKAEIIFIVLCALVTIAIIIVNTDWIF